MRVFRPAVEEYARAIARAFRRHFRNNIAFDDIYGGAHAGTYVCALRRPTVYVVSELEEAPGGDLIFLSAFIIPPDRVVMLEGLFWRYDPTRDEWFLADTRPEMEIYAPKVGPDEVGEALASDVERAIRGNLETVRSDELEEIAKRSAEEGVDVDVFLRKTSVAEVGDIIAPAYFRLLRYEAAPFTYGAFGTTTIIILLAL